jgi:6-carboxyhexanoate--CoA ligase
VKWERLFSIRMRATDRGRHVSGAERIAQEGRIEETIDGLVRRAAHRKLSLDRIIVSIDPVEEADLRTFKALDVVIAHVPDVSSCREAAFRVLLSVGVSEKAAGTAMEALSKGPALSRANMRGAMIIDSLTGERLERDRERGVRASRFDWSENGAEEIDRVLSAEGLTHFRTREALALATKVAHAPGIVAELCWSDEPDYTAGYVASRTTGYVRFPHLKQPGDPKGGRAFFVRRDDCDLETFITYLEQQPVLIASAGTCRPAASLHELLDSREKAAPHV